MKPPVRHVALIRGINVGRAKRVAMGALRERLVELGLADVVTLLNSGNVVFSARVGSSAKLAALVTGALLDLGVSAEAVVLTADELADIVAANPLLDVATDHSRLFVTVYGDPSDRVRFAALQAKSWLPDQLAVAEHAVYAWCVEGAIQSPLAKAVTRAMGPRSTTRNWATLSKLHALAR